MGDSNETSSRYIFEQMADEGIDTSRLVCMEGLVTPISNIMIDPSGERTNVAFRDPELWRVKLPCSFHGAFVLAITEGQKLRSALRLASGAAALKCTRFGGAFAAPQRAEVEELLRQDRAASGARAPQWPQ